MKPKFISIVRWKDQHYTMGPMEHKDLLFTCIGTTTGFLLAEDKEHIALGAEWFEFRDDYRHIIHIPKCAVLSHKKMRIK